MKKEQIDRLAQLHVAGILKPEVVVADARVPDSPLHALFNWTVEEAAEAHWLDRARQLIRSVEVVIHTERTVVRTPYYVRDPEAGPKEQGYRTITEVRGEADLARAVLVAEFSRAADVLRRAHDIARALNLEDDVKELIDGVVQLREQVMEAPTQQM